MYGAEFVFGDGSGSKVLLWYLAQYEKRGVVVLRDNATSLDLYMRHVAVDSEIRECAYGAHVDHVLTRRKA